MWWTAFIFQLVTSLKSKQMLSKWLMCLRHLIEWRVTYLAIPHILHYTTGLCIKLNFLFLVISRSTRLSCLFHPRKFYGPAFSSPAFSASSNVTDRCSAAAVCRSNLICNVTYPTHPLVLMTVVITKQWWVTVSSLMRLMAVNMIYFNRRCSFAVNIVLKSPISCLQYSTVVVSHEHVTVGRNG